MELIQNVWIGQQIFLFVCLNDVWTRPKVESAVTELQILMVWLLQGSWSALYTVWKIVSVWFRTDATFGMARGWLQTTHQTSVLTGTSGTQPKASYRPQTARQMPVLKGTSGVQTVAAPGLHQPAESALQKGPTLFGRLSARSAPRSLLHASEWAKKWSRCSPSHATGHPSCGQLKPIVQCSSIRMAGRGAAKLVHFRPL